jgi:hypothetical protein
MPILLTPVFHWIAGNGDWSTTVDWNPSGTPGAGDDAIIDAAGTYTVTSVATRTVNSVSTAAGATLSVTGGTFTLANGTGSGANAGTVLVGNNTELAAAGTMDNTGTIAMGSVGNGTFFIVNGSNLTLQGGGNVTLSDNSQNYIYGAAAADTLTNADNTISGAGQLGNGQLTLVNEAAGVIDAIGGNALTINTSGETLTNAGLIESSNGGGGLYVVNTAIANTGTLAANANSLLVLQGSAVVDSSGGGTVEATAAGSQIRLAGGTIRNGTLAIGSGGTLSSTGGTIDTADFSNAGNVAVSNNTALTLGGMLANTGTVALNSVGNGTFLIVNGSNLTLQGGGSVTLSDNSQNYIYGAAAADTLTNVDNTISGAGQLGNGQLTLVNEAAGVIDAIGANALTINTSGEALTNAGLIESSNGGGGLYVVNTAVANTGTLAAKANSLLVLQGSAVVDSSGGGTVEATAAGSQIKLAGGTIRNGTLAIGSGGTLSSAGGTIDTVDFSNAGNVAVSNNTALTLGGTLANTGTVALNSVGNGTFLIVNGSNLTLQGGGSVTLSDNSQNYIYGAAAADTLTNVDNTISGAGQLGNGQLTLVNEAAGVIDAIGGNALTINTSGETLTNAGLIESSNGGGGLYVVNTAIANTGTLAPNANSLLVLQGSTVVDSSGGGTVEATAAGSQIRLAGATIRNGTLTIGAGGTLSSTGGGTIDNANFSNAGNVAVGNNTTLTLGGMLANTGTLALQSVGNGTFLLIDGNNLTLQGGGQMTLSDNSQNYVYGVAAADTLTNVDNAISGAGQLGSGQLTLVNEAKGVIDATGASNALVLNTSGKVLTNAGLIEDTGTGGLSINSTTIANAGGTILAQGAGTHVDLSGAVIEGGTLEALGGGGLNILGGGDVLDGSAAAVDLIGTLSVNNNSTVTAGGTLDNTDTIALKSVGNGTFLIINGSNLTLQGGGSVTLSDNSQNYIYGAAAADTLTNVDNTFSGAGQFGSGQLTLVNEASGVINATGASNALVINTSGETLSNAGLIEATGTGGLNIVSTSVANTSTIVANANAVLSLQGSTVVDNTGGGVVKAVDPGSQIRLSGGTIRNGTLTIGAGGTLSTTGGTSLRSADRHHGTDHARSDRGLGIGHHRWQRIRRRRHRRDADGEFQRAGRRDRRTLPEAQRRRRRKLCGRLGHQRVEFHLYGGARPEHSRPCRPGAQSQRRRNRGRGGKQGRPLGRALQPRRRSANRHHSAAGDAAARARHRRFDDRWRDQGPDAEGQRRSQRLGAAQHRRQQRERDGRERRFLELRSDRPCGRPTRGCGERNRCCRQHRHRLADLHA